jgi:hypothetical protein
MHAWLSYLVGHLADVFNKWRHFSIRVQKSESRNISIRNWNIPEFPIHMSLSCLILSHIFILLIRAPSICYRYQINARTELAVRYNDISPLENHHCAVSFQIMSNPETNIFGNVDHATFKRIRSVSGDSVVNTCRIRMHHSASKIITVLCFWKRKMLSNTKYISLRYDISTTHDFIHNIVHMLYTFIYIILYSIFNSFMCSSILLHVHIVIIQCYVFWQHYAVRSMYIKYYLCNFHLKVHATLAHGVVYWQRKIHILD